MAGKGRPTVDDKRDNQYRVRLNDEGNQMLAYCSQMTRQPKSQIFRKALEEYYQTVQLNEMEMGMDGISMRRVIKCPHCGAANAIDLSDFSTGDYESERQMGAEIQHCFDCEDYECVKRTASQATNGLFQTTKSFLDEYERSSSYYGTTKEKNHKLIDYLSSIINQEAKRLGRLTPDASTVLNRCQEKIRYAKTHDDVFTGVSNFLWIIASKKAATGYNFSLTDDALLERNYAAEWITEFAKKIEKAQYDLSCMEEADNLSFGKQIFLGLIKNPDVAWYADRENISYEDFKQRIQNCRQYITENQIAYYVFVATAIYREDLRERYR